MVFQGMPRALALASGVSPSGHRRQALAIAAIMRGQHLQRGLLGAGHSQVRGRGVMRWRCTAADRSGAGAPSARCTAAGSNHGEGVTGRQPVSGEKGMAARQPVTQLQGLWWPG